MQFESKVALVTGGSSGIGLGIATHLAQLGAHVIITGRDPAKLAQAAQSIGPNVSSAALDVTKVAEIDALYETVRRDHGRLDILVANAGGGQIIPLGSLTEEHVDRTFDHFYSAVGTLAHGSRQFDRHRGFHLVDQSLTWSERLRCIESSSAHPCSSLDPRYQRHRHSYQLGQPWPGSHGKP